MYKRYLDCTASELKNITKNDLIQALRGSEGRVLVSEIISTVQPMLFNITNAEFVASRGADMVLLNMFDVNSPQINGLPSEVNSKDCIQKLQFLTGRIIGIGLEPVFNDVSNDKNNLWNVTSGRIATGDNAKKALEMGAKFILLSGNPGNGITNKEISNSLREIKTVVGDNLILIAGKMHASGIMTESAENIITQFDIDEFVKNGADIILLPAPGTIPGITVEIVRNLVIHAHNLGVMTMTAIGTSQEGADIVTIQQIALMAKMTGTDLHHIGDSGYIGMALPENIFAYSVAIRGKRHTYSRIASSINR